MVELEDSRMPILKEDMVKLLFKSAVEGEEGMQG